MSDLSDLAEDLAKGLPIAARKVIDKALEGGWELNPPGMTVCLRLSHPTDDLGVPVYVAWAVKRTPTGRIGFTFVGASTASLIPLRPAEVLDYLEDPSAAYSTPEELQEAQDASWARREWSDRKTTAENLRDILGAEVIGVIDERPGRETAAQIIARANRKMQEEPSKPAAGQPSPARGLRVSL